MTALSADRNTLSKNPGDIRSYAVEDNVKIYKGGLVVADSSGYARPARNTAGEVILGVADEQVDNTLTGHTAGGKNVRVLSGRHFLLTATGMSQANVGQSVVYALDDATVRTTVGNGNLVGIVTGYESATSVWVWIPTPIPGMAMYTIGGIAAGYRVARGQATTVTASDTIATGLTTVVSAVANLEDAPVIGCDRAQAVIGDQAGTPAAGSILLKTYKPTAAGDATPVAATTFGKKANWIAIGT